MTRYHMFFYDINETAKNIFFYSTDATILDYISIDIVTRFGASEVDGNDIAQAGELTIYFRGPVDFRYPEHYINQLLCGNGWEPYGEYCFRLRYEA